MADNVRVAYFADRPMLGGAELSLIDYFRYAEQFGITPILVTTRESPLTREASAVGVRSSLLAAPELVAYEQRPNVLRATSSPVRLAKYGLQAQGTIRRLSQLLVAERIDILHTNSMRAHLYGVIAAKLVRVPVVVHIRDMPQRRYVRLALRAAIGIADAGIVISEAVSSCLWARRPRKVVLLRNGVDVARLAPARDGRGGLRAELGLERKRPLVGIVGQVTAWKGHLDFVRAAARVHRELPDAHFLIIGDSLLNPTEFKEQVRAEIEALGLQEAITFTGFRSDVPAVLSTLDIVVSASWHEPLGRVILEALSLGRPLIGTLAGGTPELVEHGVNGLLVPPKNPGALAAAILRWAHDPEEARRCGESGRQRAREEFHVEAELKRIGSLYADMLGRTVDGHENCH